MVWSMSRQRLASQPQREASESQRPFATHVPPCRLAPVGAALRPRRPGPSRLLAVRAGSSHTLCLDPGDAVWPQPQGQLLSQTTQVSRVSYQPHVPSAGVGQGGAWGTGTKPASGPSACAAAQAPRRGRPHLTSIARLPTQSGNRHAVTHLDTAREPTRADLTRNHQGAKVSKRRGHRVSA